MSRKRGTNTSQMRLEARRLIDAERRWYVVETHPGCERAAAMDFIGRDIAIWLPHFRAVTVRRGKTAEASGLFFPGYLFAGLAPAMSPGPLWTVKHVMDVLGADKPLVLPPLIVQALADRLTGNVRSERLAVAAAYRVGEMRQVVKGAFSSFMGEVTEVLATGRVKVDISIFGRATSVELDPDFLDAA